MRCVGVGDMVMGEILKERAVVETLRYQKAVRLYLTLYIIDYLKPRCYWKLVEVGPTLSVLIGTYNFRV